MTFLTRLALRRSSVTILIMILVLAGGVYVYNTLERELFPEIEFPNITINTIYPSANPETVARDVSEPIEEAISNIDGLREIESSSSQNISLVLATFEFGEDMEEAERTIESSINGIQFPAEVQGPFVSRINNNTFPVIQLTVIGDRDIPSMQRILNDAVVPRLEQVEGVFSVTLVGQVAEQVTVTVDTDKLEDLGLSMFQVSQAISNNNSSFPAGNIDQNGATFPVRTTHELGSLEEIRNLTIGYERVSLPGDTSADNRGQRPVLLSNVAEVTMGTAEASSISRTNGKASLNVVVVKDPDANTVDVTSGVLDVVDSLEGLPPDIQLLVLSNDGPEVERSLSNLLREGLLGFLFAITAVFIFLINTRPTLLRGIVFTLRPTAIIGISIPLSVLSGVLLMSLANLSLNFMSLAGLAIAVGRVVDDSIVVLENMYRHIQRGEDRLPAAINGTQEVGAAIVSSTLTTVVVFVPLAFIPGLVGEFFTPFAMSVSFALLASTVVALTAVPVLGVMLLRRGDFPDADVSDDMDIERETWLQRLYVPILSWSIRHKLLTLLAAIIITGSSLGLVFVIPITFFPAGAPDYITIDVELPTGTSIRRTFEEAAKMERVLDGFVDSGHIEVYQITLGGSADDFGSISGAGNFHVAGGFAKMAENVPEDIAERIRSQLPGDDDVTITVNELANGPPTGGLDITIVGLNFTAITAVAKELEAEIETIDGIINVSGDVTEGRDEVTININPQEAAEFGLTASDVGQLINQFIVGRSVSEIDLDEITMDIVVRGRPEDVDDIEKLKSLNVQGPLGLVKLGSISDISIEQGPVTVSRFDQERSASITGTITAVDTQAVGQLVQEKIDALELPPGVEVRTGGIFEQITEGFQNVFVAMAAGIILVYLVMVASLGSLRNPFIIVLSLPLAIVGALVALAVTDRTLSLSAMMGFLLLIGIVVTNAIVLITFVEQLRERGMEVEEALIRGGRVRIRPILMTAFTTTFALLPLAVSSSDDGGIIGSELATVVIGGLISSTALTLIAVPVIYMLMHWSIPRLPGTIKALFRRRGRAGA